MPAEGREPDDDRADGTRQFPVGEHGPFSGQVPTRADADIKHDVDSALFYDETVSSIGIDVTVQNGDVTLDGTTTSDLAKRVAGDDAWRVVGVKNVANNLEVKETPTPSRAAGQDLVDAKPPEPIYGEPPEKQSKTA